MTSFPDVNNKMVQFGRTRRKVTAANFRLLNEEKRNIWFSLSSCNGALVSIWAVATILCTKGKGRISGGAGSGSSCCRLLGRSSSGSCFRLPRRIVSSGSSTSSFRLLKSIESSGSSSACFRLHPVDIQLIIHHVHGHVWGVAVDVYLSPSLLA